MLKSCPVLRPSLPFSEIRCTFWSSQRLESACFAPVPIGEKTIHCADCAFGMFGMVGIWHARARILSPRKHQRNTKATATALAWDVLIIAANRKVHLRDLSREHLDTNNQIRDKWQILTSYKCYKWQSEPKWNPVTATPREMNCKMLAYRLSTRIWWVQKNQTHCSNNIYLLKSRCYEIQSSSLQTKPNQTFLAIRSRTSLRHDWSGCKTGPSNKSFRWVRCCKPLRPSLSM